VLGFIKAATAHVTQAILKGLGYGQKCLQVYADSEAYHEQMGPRPSSNGSVEMALSIAHT